MTGMTYGIVAGYDGSPDGARALRWAAREAQARGTTLTVCLAWTPDHMALPTESDLSDLARQHGREILARGLLGEGRQVEEDFDHLMAREAKMHPEVTVVRRVLPGTPRAALLTASAGAQLIVVGSRGRGGLEGMSLGSVAQAVLHHAPGPVGVVH
jgi:nucleotide-binding universal stress UspA family protein